MKAKIIPSVPQMHGINTQKQYLGEYVGSNAACRGPVLVFPYKKLVIMLHRNDFWDGNSWNVIIKDVIPLRPDQKVEVSNES